jgi:hypothetical protein
VPAPSRRSRLWRARSRDGSVVAQRVLPRGLRAGAAGEELLIGLEIYRERTAALPVLPKPSNQSFSPFLLLAGGTGDCCCDKHGTD